MSGTRKNKKNSWEGETWIQTSILGLQPLFFSDSFHCNPVVSQRRLQHSRGIWSVRYLWQGVHFGQFRNGYYISTKRWWWWWWWGGGGGGRWFQRSDKRHVDTLKCSSKVASGQKLAGKGTEGAFIEVTPPVNCGDQISWFLFRKQLDNKSCEDLESVWLCKSWTLFFSVGFHLHPFSMFNRILVEMILFCLQSFIQNAETSKRLEEGDGRLGIPEWDNMVQLPKAVAGCKDRKEMG